jgi:peptidoglycan hydrolase-like protein with peptidoglycan-binding domain
MLARLGLFKNQIDGNFGPDMEFSLRAYQSRVGLRPTGRLDLETLAALELLPGARRRIFGPRRGLRPPGEPPVRGEWIHP